MSPTLITLVQMVHLSPCPTMLAENARGLFGFHAFSECPNCIKTLDCYEAHAGDSMLSPLLAYFDNPEFAREYLAKTQPQAKVSIGQPVHFRR